MRHRIDARAAVLGFAVAVLTAAREDQEEGEQSAHCCSIEREAD